jgi:hypothetical protein
MYRGHWVFGSAFLLLVWICVEDACGAARVELVLAAERHAPLVAQQTWVRELGEAGIHNVRLRQQRSTDRVGIQVQGTKESPIYVVNGTLDSRGEVILPGGRYRPGQARRIATWLRDVARRGPPDSREPLVAFGLPKSQMMAVHKDLAVPIDFSTRDKERADVVRKIAGRLKLPVRVDGKMLARAADDRMADELEGLSRGTALAYVLRPAGLALVPKMAGSGPEYRITTARGQRETWPVGWKPERSRPKLLPEMFSLRPINLKNVSIAKVLEVIGKRLGIPVLLDHGALARHGIDPEKTLVTVPRSRTSYATVLDKALFQAWLKYELRTDEAGKPFLWVTTIKQQKAVGSKQ